MGRRPEGSDHNGGRISMVMEMFCIMTAPMSLSGRDIVLWTRKMLALGETG